MGCGASASRKGEGAPNLQMYFQELEKFTNLELQELEEVSKLQSKGDVAAIIEKQKSIKANRTAFKVTAEKLLNSCFDHHDVSGDGILSKEESANLFGYIVAENSDYLSTMAKAETRRMLAEDLGMSKKMFDKYDIEDEEVVRKKLEEGKKAEAKRNMADIDAGMKKAIESYKAEKLVRDKAAFAVLDTSSDGRIQKKEFLAAFDSTSDVYEAFLTALGLCNF